MGFVSKGNRTKLRKRDGSELTFQYDALNRMAAKIVPQRAGLTAAQTRDVHYAYDLRGLQTKARFDSLAGEGVSNAYDGFGRLVSSTTTMGGVSRTLSNLYDGAGNRSRLTHPDGGAFGFLYDGLGRMTYLHDNPAITHADDYVIRYFYKAEGPRYVAIRGVGSGGFTTAYHYDPVQRLSMMVNDLPGAPNDMTVSLGYNPASQIRRYDRDNNAYAWTESVPVTRNYAANGLNQYVGTSTGGEFAYDLNGNLISSRNGTAVTNYVYDVENRLVSASGAHSAFLVYDPLGRLFWVSGPNTGMTQFLYDGDDLVAEYNGWGTLTRRYVHGPGTDDPVAVYEGAALGLAGRRYTLPDERGSIATLVDANGNPVAINTYDEYGIPGASNQGRFQYTGQAWIPEFGLYYYKARFYSPTLGRFLQVDPIGYDDQVNLYAYVGNDPVNGTDPTGQFRDIYVGGGGDSVTQNVKSYAERQQVIHPDRDIRYFSYNDITGIDRALRAPLGPGEPLNAIGHSWGASTIVNRAEVTAAAIDNLVAIDPVGYLPDGTELGNVGQWTNVMATPTAGDRDLSDTVASIGRSLTNDPKGTLDKANTTIQSSQNHRDFRSMMTEAKAPKLIDDSYRRK